MADAVDQAAQDAQAAAQAATDAQAAAAAASSSDDKKDKDTELADLRAALKAANKEAGDRRKRLKELEDAEEARSAAQMSELDKANKRAADAEARAEAESKNAREMLIRSEFIAEGAKAGVAHPEDLYLLADRTAIDVNDVGKVEGVAEAVKALVDAGRVPLSGKPLAPNLDGGAGNGGRASNAAVKLTQEELDYAKKMGVAPDAYAKQVKQRAERLAHASA